MKIFHASDHHWNHLSRWAECVRIHWWIAGKVREEKPALFISTGDVYERASTPEERLAVAEWYAMIADVCPVVVVKGNHDVHRDCQLLARLRTRHPLIVEERAAVHVIAGVAVAAVAWPERQHLLTHARDHGADPDILAHEALQHVFRGLAAELDKHKGLPRVAAGHFMVDGCVTSVGQPLIGRPMHVSLADLALLNCDIVLMGHIHKPQDWKHGGVPMVYAGSPYRTAYGETEDKSIVQVEFGLVKPLDDREPEQLMRWKRIPTPCAPMYLIQENWSREGDDSYCFDAGPEAWVPFEAPDNDPNLVLPLSGAEIRMRYTVDHEQQVPARVEAEKWKAQFELAGAADVQIEPVVTTTTRARAPEIAAAKTLADKLAALWKARDTTPESPRKERLIGLAQSLESDQDVS